jgi:hypothetical protein
LSATSAVVASSAAGPGNAAPASVDVQSFAAIHSPTFASHPLSLAPVGCVTCFKYDDVAPKLGAEFKYWQT